MNDSSIWIERFRPKTFDEVIGQDKIVNRIKAFVKQKNLPHLLFSGPAGVGKCVVENTPVVTGEGNVISIKKVFDEKINKIMTLDEKGQIVSRKISYIFKSKTDQTIKLKTAFGSEVEVTPEHPFLCLKKGKLDWQEARDIKKGMQIIGPSLIRNTIKDYKLKIPPTFIEIGDKICHAHGKRTSCKIKRVELNEDFFYWLGLVFGDGNFKNASIRFYNINPSLREKFKALSYKLFGEEIEILDFDANCPYSEIRKATTIVKLLEYNLSHDICCKKSDILEVPQFLFNMNNKKIASFIRGMYETDGSIYGSVVEIAAKNRIFLSQISYLFLSLEIRCKIKANRIIISGSEDISNFLSIIKPSIKNKFSKKIHNPNLDILTVNREEFSNTLKQLGIEWIDLVNNKKEIEYILERERGGRKKIFKIYRKILSIAREKIAQSLTTIGILENLKMNIEPSIVINELKNRKLRLNLDCGIRTDRLKEYADHKREPNLKNYLKILKVLSVKNASLETLQKNIKQLLVVRNSLLNTMSLLKISYVEVASYCGMFEGSVNHMMNQQGLSFSSIRKLEDIFLSIKQQIEKRIYDKQLIAFLENIDYLMNAQIKFDKVLNVEKKNESKDVYDLNVEGTHNFVGGDSSLILHNTSLILVAARELYRENWRQNILETNASMDRGINIVREQIKDFARTKAIGNTNFKICILDEADALTREAQQALRRTMEQYSGICRFCLITNWSSKIIDPIQSRCTIFRFKPLEKGNIHEIIKKIIKEEKLKINEKGKEALVYVSNGDVRRLENVMQSCSVISKEITEELVYEIVSSAKPKEIKEVLELAIKGNFTSAKGKLLDVMLMHGLSGLDIIKQIQQEIWNLDLNDNKKIELVDKCGEVEFRMVEGSDEFLQLESLLVNFMKK